MFGFSLIYSHKRNYLLYQETSGLYENLKIRKNILVNHPKEIYIHILLLFQQKLNKYNHIIFTNQNKKVIFMLIKNDEIEISLYQYCDYLNLNEVDPNSQHCYSVQ